MITYADDNTPYKICLLKATLMNYFSRYELKIYILKNKIEKALLHLRMKEVCSEFHDTLLKTGSMITTLKLMMINVKRFKLNSPQSDISENGI